MVAKLGTRIFLVVAVRTSLAADAAFLRSKRACLAVTAGRIECQTTASLEFTKGALWTVPRARSAARRSIFTSITLFACEAR